MGFFLILNGNHFDLILCLKFGIIFLKKAAQQGATSVKVSNTHIYRLLALWSVVRVWVRWALDAASDKVATEMSAGPQSHLAAWMEKHPSPSLLRLWPKGYDLKGNYIYIYIWIYSKSSVNVISSFLEIVILSKTAYNKTNFTTG